MTRKEFLAWREFYRAYPFDDRYRYHRPAALLAAMNGGKDVSQYLDWLIPGPEIEGFSNPADVATLRAFGITPPRKDE